MVRKQSHGPVKVLLHGAWMVFAFYAFFIALFVAIHIRFTVGTTVSLLLAAAGAAIMMYGTHVGYGYIKGGGRFLWRKATRFLSSCE